MKAAVLVLVMSFPASSALSQNVEEALSVQNENSLSALGSSVSFGLANFSQPGEFNLSGPSVGLGVAGRIDLDEADPIYIEWYGSMAWGSGFSSSTEVQGSEPVLYNSRRSPVGDVDLSTMFEVNGASAEAVVSIIDSLGDTATIYSSAFSPNTPNTAVTQYAASFTEAGGIFAALTTDGGANTASAYGGLFDNTGVSFIGTGEESSTTVTTSIEDNVRLSNQALFLSNRIALADDWTLAPKIGPTYRRFDRSHTTRTIFDIQESSGTTSEIPTFSVDDSWALSGRYYGAILGAGLSRKIRDDWSVNLGAEAGLAKYNAKSETVEMVNLGGSASAIPGLNKSLDGTASIGRVTGSLTHVTKDGAIINFGGYVDYMSDVPYLQFETVGSPDVTASGTSARLAGRGETFRTHSIQKSKMVSSGLSFSIIFLF